MFQTEAIQRLAQPTSSNTGILLPLRLNYLQSLTDSVVDMQHSSSSGVLPLGHKRSRGVRAGGVH